MEQQRLPCNRDAIYGCRIKAKSLHYKAQANDNIQYVDVLTMYTYINKYFNFPVCHPVIHVGDTCKNTETCLRMSRLIKFSMIPTERFFHNVLRFRYNKKLRVFLCRTCVDNFSFSSTEECMHNRNKYRRLTETCLIDEMWLAVVTCIA